MAEREVRYCTTEDGVRIAYYVEGDGPPLFVPQFFVESIATLSTLNPEWAGFYETLADGHSLVRYDARDTGLSEREVEDLSHDALVRDMEAVVAAAKLKRFALFAETNSVPRSIDYAVRHPAQVTHLVLAGGYARVADVLPPQILHSFAELARSNWPLAAQALTDIRGRSNPTAAQEHVLAAAAYRDSASGETVARLMTANANTDVSDLLPLVKSRTLILHSVVDEFAPLRVAQEMAARIPDSRLVTITGDYWRTCSEALHAFLGSKRRNELGTGKTSPTAFRTIIFSDVVENTALLRRIGDEAWRAVMREHDEIVRAALKEHGGTEISTSGDGFFASFGSSVRALQCAVEMQRALARRNESAEHPVEVRIGLNAGEPIEEGKDVLGTAVTMAARIMSQAGAGEILVSDVLRQLVAGKRFLFADRGEFVAKGFEEPVRVYEVRWRE